MENILFLSFDVILTDLVIVQLATLHKYSA